MIDFKIGIKEKHKSQKRTKLSENLHNHVHAEILPTDAFELQISALLVVIFLERQYSLSFSPNIWQLNETSYLNFL